MEIITHLFKNTHALLKLKVNLELRFLDMQYVKRCENNKGEFGSSHSTLDLNMIQFMCWLFVYLSDQFFFNFNRAH